MIDARLSDTELLVVFPRFQLICWVLRRYYRNAHDLHRCHASAQGASIPPRCRKRDGRWAARGDGNGPRNGLPRSPLPAKPH